MGDDQAGHDEPKGVDVEAVTAWFVEHVEGVHPPLRFALLPGGHSNITHRVTDGRGASWVFRRPPLGHVLASAHDMAREYRAIAALGPTAVPVARAHGLCEDPTVTGAPFYVMDHVAGHVLHHLDDAVTHLDQPQRRRAGLSLIDVLAELHTLDVDRIGLGDHGRRDAYVERQLRRWHGQWEQSKTRDLPALDRVHAALAADVPEPGPAAVVHGDYRFGNVLCGADGPIAAVLDWEISTLGDPLADLGYTVNYWVRPGDDGPFADGQPTLAPGMPERDEILARYAERTGRDLARIDYYRAFSYWKSACIAEGVYARYLGGALGDTSGVDLAHFERSVVGLAEAAERALRAAGH